MDIHDQTCEMPTDLIAVLEIDDGTCTITRNSLVGNSVATVGAAARALRQIDQAADQESTWPTQRSAARRGGPDTRTQQESGRQSPDFPPRARHSPEDAS